MRSSPVRRLVASTVLAVVTTGAFPTSAQARQGGLDVAAITARSIRFEGQPGVVTRVFDGRYAETIEVRRAPGGDLVIVNDLSMDAYVEGIAEMPSRWPLEALKAQAVAARTYAWFELEQGRWSRFGYDVCATTSCQVFRGRDVVETPLTGGNWARAVQETSGQVLVQDGAPILARYFSTSGGRTWDNDEIFPSEGEFPYLKGVEDPDDAVSPLHRWRVPFTREQFDRLLSRGRSLASVSPMASIEAVPSEVEGLVDVVRVTGVSGDVVEVDPVDFRSFVSGVAPSLWPDQYPGQKSDGSGPLPATMPSSRFEFEVDDEQVVIDGRGWGHGVGMGQYGAMGKAERGLSHTEILAAYYGGLQPVESPDLPATIRVGLEALRDEVPVRLDGPARLVIGDQVITERALGTWFVQDGPGSQVSVIPPDGFGEPLQVEPTTTTRTTPNEVEIIELRTSVSKPVEVRLDVRALSGELLSSTPLGVHELGAVVVAWSLEDVAGRALPPGSYDVLLVATDENGTEEGTPVTISVRPFVVDDTGRGLPPTIWTAARADGPSTFLDPVLLALAALLGLGLGRAAGLAAGRRRHATAGVA